MFVFHSFPTKIEGVAKYSDNSYWKEQQLRMLKWQYLFKSDHFLNLWCILFLHDRSILQELGLCKVPDME